MFYVSPILWQQVAAVDEQACSEALCWQQPRVTPVANQGLLEEARRRVEEMVLGAAAAVVDHFQNDRGITLV